MKFLQGFSHDIFRKRWIELEREGISGAHQRKFRMADLLHCSGELHFLHRHRGVFSQQWVCFSIRTLMLKICSIVLLVLKPACSFASVFSAWPFNLFSIILNMILLGWSNWWFCCSDIVISWEEGWLVIVSILSAILAFPQFFWNWGSLLKKFWATMFQELWWYVVDAWWFTSL